MCGVLVSKAGGPEKFCGSTKCYFCLKCGSLVPLRVYETPRFRHQRHDVKGSTVWLVMTVLFHGANIKIRHRPDKRLLLRIGIHSGTRTTRVYGQGLLPWKLLPLVELIS